MTKKYSIVCVCVHIFFFFEDFIYLFLERGEGGRGGMKRSTPVCGYPLRTPPTGDLAPTQARALTENQMSDTGSHAHAQSTELHQPGPHT